MTQLALTPTTDAAGHYLRELLDRPFTDSQLAVATAGLEPQLVVAGAGSGKTTVMAARVVHAVAHFGVPAEQVLGLTFTNKAAGQLASQVRAALRRLHAGSAVTADDDSPTVATYHSYAAGIVRDHALRIGREPVTTLMTEAGRWQLAMRVVRRARGPFHHLRLQPATVAERLLLLDGELAEHLVTPEEVARFDARLVEDVAAAKQINKVLDIAQTAHERQELLTLVTTYRAEKQRLDLLDYGDQVALAAQVAQQAPEVGELERARYRLVLLDEYQDTGVAQRLLLTALYAGRHAVTAVGDPNQAIYGWRGASVGNLLRFHEHFGGDGDAQPLMTSFRCDGRILAAANALSEPLRQNATIAVPELVAAPGRESDGRVVIALHERVDGEAQWVAQAIADVLVDGLPGDPREVRPGDIAVLCRRRTDFPLLHSELVALDVPVEVVGLGGLLEMPEVADVVATLRVLVEPTANPAMLRLLTGPRWRIGARDLAALGRRARRLASTTGPDAAQDDAGQADVALALRLAAEGVDPVDVPALSDAIDDLHPGAVGLSAEAVDRLLRLRLELHELRGSLGQPIVEIAGEVIRRTGLDVELEVEPTKVAQARAGNLAAFLDHAAAFTGVEGETDLVAFLGWLDAAMAAESGLDVGAVSEADTVKLLTVHKAKGLEWRVVAVPGLTKKVFPSDRGRSRWTSQPQVLPYSCRGDAEDLPGDPVLTSKGIAEFETDCRTIAADEERRLGYVATTRAASLLLASGYWWGRTQRNAMGPSDLLVELHDLAADGVVEIDTWCEVPVDPDNPMAAELAVDVPWPRPVDSVATVNRRNAATLVLAASDAPGGDTSRLTEVQRDDLEVWDTESRLLLDELRAGQSTVRDVVLPRRLTASQVVALAADPQRLAASLARPVPSRPAPQARRGSRFHRWVEELYGAAPLIDPDDLPGAGDSALSDTELAQLQQRFLADGWGDRRPVAVEAGFELVLGGRLVRGRIDAVYPSDDGGFDVIDFKTGAPPTSEEERRAVAMQLAVYRVAWAELSGVDIAAVAAGFLYVRTGEVRRPPDLLDRDELTALLAGDAPSP